MLAASLSPIRRYSAAKEFRLGLKADYKNVAEKMRFVELGFVAPFIEISPTIGVDDADGHYSTLRPDGRSRSSRTWCRNSSTSKSAVN